MDAFIETDNFYAIAYEEAPPLVDPKVDWYAVYSKEDDLQLARCVSMPNSVLGALEKAFELGIMVGINKDNKKAASK